MGRSIQRCGLLLAVLSMVATIGWPAVAAAASATVRITDRLEPATVRVSAGSTVVWRNDSGDRHRMRSVNHSGDADWDTGNIDPGERGSVRFSRPGTFAYVDERDDDNPAFHGTVIVSADAGGAGGGGGALPRSVPATPTDVGTPAGRTVPTAATVSIAGRAFSPPSVTISAGGTVTFRNADHDEHTATASDVSWDSGVLAPGASSTHRFPAPGTFAFLCLIHPDMQGTVIVRGAAGAAPDPTPPQPAPANPRPAPTSSPAPTSRATPAGHDAAAPGAADVAIVDLAFEPATVEAVPGTTFRWTNRGAAPHTATADGGTFDSGILAAGESFEVTLDTPGTYTYACQLHPGMAGSIVVAASASQVTASSTDEPSARPAATSATPVPVAIADTGGAGASGAVAASAEPSEVSPSRASFDLGRLAVVVLLAGSAMVLFGKIVRATVRPG